jgi:hypothetical protein
MEPITRNSIGIDGEVFEDRRGMARHRVLKGGMLSFNKGYGALECVVRNLSDSGARLAFGDTAAVPPRFGLRISGHDMVRDAQVRWRTLTDVGVEFVSETPKVGHSAA